MLQLSNQEPCVEARIVCHDHPLVEQLHEPGHDLHKRRRIEHVNRADAMDALRAQVAFRVHERVPPAGHLAIVRDVQDRRLDDAVVATGKQPGRLEVDNGKAGSGPAAPLDGCLRVFRPCR